MLRQAKHFLPKNFFSLMKTSDIFVKNLMVVTYLFVLFLEIGVRFLFHLEAGVGSVEDEGALLAVLLAVALLVCLALATDSQHGRLLVVANLRANQCNGIWTSKKVNWVAKSQKLGSKKSNWVAKSQLGSKKPKIVQQKVNWAAKSQKNQLTKKSIG